jgi:hypothetical protein
MQRQKLRSLAILLIAIASLLFGICSVEERFAGIVHVPHLLFRIFLVVGFLLTVASGIIAANLFGRSLFSNATIRSYDVQVADRGDLEDLHDFCEKHAGEHFATLESWRKRYDKNPDTFFMIKETRKKRFKTTLSLVGAFTIIPVNESARELLERDELNAVTFSSTHIAAPSEKPAALYVSGVVGSSFRGRGYALSFLKDRLKTELERGNSLVYTRPMTKDGLRLAKAHGFSPVNPVINKADRIYKKELRSGSI